MADATPPKPWKGKPVTCESYVSDDGILKPLDMANFSAAGALIWNRTTSRALLAVEARQGQIRYNFLGGKRDDVEESPREVAARECFEETGGSLSIAAVTRLQEGGKPVAWNGVAKYALFVHEIFDDEDGDIADKVAAVGDRPSPVHDANLSGVAWVPLANLLDNTWCRRELHRFAHDQVKGAAPIIRRLLGTPDDCLPALAARMATPSLEHAIEFLDTQLAALSMLEAPAETPLIDGLCSECMHPGRGHVDAAEGKFYCEACWVSYNRGRWPCIGAKSEAFKNLTKDMPLCTFGSQDEATTSRFGHSMRIALIQVEDDGFDDCNALRSSGMLNGRVVVGFDTESRPTYRPGPINPICLVQLSTPSLAVLFRLRRDRPLPLALRALLQDTHVTFVGQEIVGEMQQLAAAHSLAVPENIVELKDATRAQACLCAGVAGYAAALLGIRLHKTKSLQMSNWEAPTLSHRQLKYAATDAWVCWLALEVLESPHQLRACREQRPSFFFDTADTSVVARSAPTSASSTSAIANAVAGAVGATEGAVSQREHGVRPDDEDDSASSAPQQNQAPVEPPRNPRPPRRRHGDKACRFFLTPAGCWRGESCKFIHVSAGDGAVVDVAARAERENARVLDGRSVHETQSFSTSDLSGW